MIFTSNARSRDRPRVGSVIVNHPVPLRIPLKLHGVSRLTLPCILPVLPRSQCSILDLSVLQFNVLLLHHLVYPVTDLLEGADGVHVGADHQFGVVRRGRGWWLYWLLVAGTAAVATSRIHIAFTSVSSLFSGSCEASVTRTKRCCKSPLGTTIYLHLT